MNGLVKVVISLVALTGGIASADAQGSRGSIPGTGDAAAQNLPSTVGVGRKTGNGYYSGVGGGEQPYHGYGSPSYSGRSAYRSRYPAYRTPYAYGAPYGYPRIRGYGYGFFSYPY